PPLLRSAVSGLPSPWPSQPVEPECGSARELADGAQAHEPAEQAPAGAVAGGPALPRGKRIFLKQRQDRFIGIPAAQPGRDRQKPLGASGKIRIKVMGESGGLAIGARAGRQPPARVGLRPGSKGQGASVETDGKERDRRGPVKAAR